MDVLLFYLQSFCRFAIIIVFTASFVGKIRDLPSFEQTIVKFNLLPLQLTRITAQLFLLGEVAAALLLLIGGWGLAVGFVLALIQLTLFSLALASVLARKIQTPCHCFGSSEKPVSRYDLWRNGGFIVCALVGLIGANMDSSLHLSVFETGLVALMAIPFVVLWINLGELVRLFD